MLTVNEHYTSVQGEGPRTGTLTQFIRFAGCNMRCPGWPCDTQHAIIPEIWREESERLTFEDLSARVMSEWRTTGAANICFTGGEPLIQPTQDLFDLTMDLKHLNPDLKFEVFTNGSREIPVWMLNNFQVNMDWKLAGSGEATHGLEMRRKNVQRLPPERSMIKFVCRDANDLDEALGNAILLEPNTHADFWLGAVWGTLTAADIVEFIKTHSVPFKLNVQVHKYIYSPEARRI